MRTIFIIFIASFLPNAAPRQKKTWVTQTNTRKQTKKIKNTKSFFYVKLEYIKNKTVRIKNKIYTKEHMLFKVSYKQYNKYGRHNSKMYQKFIFETNSYINRNPKSISID